MALAIILISIFSYQQKKNVVDGGVPNGRGADNEQETRVRLLCKFKSLPSPLLRVSRGLESSSSWSTKGDTLTNGDSLVNVNVSSEKATSTWVFRASPEFAVLKK